MTTNQPLSSIHHIESCVVGKAKLSDHDHKWSGWPGAYCLICNCDDPNEICVADNCKCPCHDELWKSYNEYCEQHKESKEIDNE